MASSQINKRWPTAKWIKLAHKILANSDENIVLLPGQSKKEIGEAMLVSRSVGQKRCKLINNESIKNLTLRIDGLKCFISNDTGFLHIAAAVNTPTVGLYISTNSEIWSPYDKTNIFFFTEQLYR